MQHRHLDRYQYFLELSNTSRDFYVGHVCRFITVSTFTRVLEIGCGEGGNLLPFAQLGCYVKGIDLDKERVEQACTSGRVHCYRPTVVVHKSPLSAEISFDSAQTMAFAWTRAVSP